MKTFPMYTIQQGCKVLDLFNAWFGGDHTIKHFWQQVGDYTGVDIDKEKMAVVRSQYPQGRFKYVVDDVYTFLDTDSDTYDVVISDQWTNQNERLYSVLPKLAKRAKKYLVISTNVGSMAILPVMVNDFHIECFWWRSDYLGGTYWAVYSK